MDTKGGKLQGVGGGGVMNWEIGIDMYTLMCIKWMNNKKKNKLIIYICIYIYRIYYFMNWVLSALAWYKEYAKCFKLLDPNFPSAFIFE